MQQKALAIIDVQTLFLTARSEYGPSARMDYVKLSKFLKDLDPTLTVDMAAYILASPMHDDSKFIKFLKNNGYIVMRKFAELKKNSDVENGNLEFKNSSWAGSMAWDVLTTLPYYDTVYIVSGNGSFCPIVSACHAAGKPVTVLSFVSSLQKELGKLADKVIYLDGTFLFNAEAIKAKYQKVTN